MGDVCLTPANEAKAITSIIQYVDRVAVNVQQVLGGGSELIGLPAGPDFHNLFFIPLGKSRGLVCMNGMVKFDKSVPKSKDEI